MNVKSIYRLSEGGILKEEGEKEDVVLTPEEAEKRMRELVSGGPKK